jgi:S-adenosyl methyltransferase
LRRSEDGVSEHGLTADQINTSQPHPARMYDYYLGGRDNYEIDRIAANRIISVIPGIIDGARQNRGFLRRAVQTIVAEHGIRQIIDIGTGIPTSPNTHEVAQAVAPETRVVYMDNDPIVGVHANARLTGVGHTTFLLADAREAASIMARLRSEELIDFSKPVGLVIVALLHFLTDMDEPYQVAAELYDALPSGSFVVLSHATGDGITADFAEPMAELVDVYKNSAASLTLRSYDQVRGFFNGLELIEPGITTVGGWRPDPGTTVPPGLGIYAGVARKP